MKIVLVLYFKMIIVHSVAPPLRMIIDPLFFFARICPDPFLDHLLKHTLTTLIPFIIVSTNDAQVTISVLETVHWHLLVFRV